MHLIIRLLVIFLPLNLSFAQQQSTSVGSVSNGKLINGARMPFKGNNHKYFMWFSYGILKRAYVHHKVKKAVLEAYAKCEKEFPERKFILMECSRKKGGRMLPHRTHQNGLSIDFATPLLKNGKPYSQRNIFNLHGYSIDFDNDGKKIKNQKVQVDFETMAKHLYLLNEACRKNGLKIEKVIFHTDLQKKLFATQYGRKIKDQMYFVKALTPKLNKHHDEHYHVDFALL